MDLNMNLCYTVYTNLVAKDSSQALKQTILLY